jgi:hypothetical protein
MVATNGRGKRIIPGSHELRSSCESLPTGVSGCPSSGLWFGLPVGVPEIVVDGSESDDEKYVSDERE